MTEDEINNTVDYNKFEINRNLEPPLLILTPDGKYEGPYAKNGKEWCDGFMAGFRLAQSQI